MNKFLLTRQEIDDATKFLEDNFLVCSGISAKNWEVFQVIPYFRDGNMMDMGSDGGVVLQNALKKRISGLKIGIDLAYPDNPVSPDKGIDLVKGDLMVTPFPDGFFKTITSLSVIEHSVDISKFAKECSRLLSDGGQLFVSFDYWPEKIDTQKTKLYSLDWNILSEEDVEQMVFEMGENGLRITSSIDWTVKDKVINDTYCSPVPGVGYTFGIFAFTKSVL